MDIRASDLGGRVGPTVLVEAVARPLRLFLGVCGHAPLLCVDVASSVELEAGLQAAASHEGGGATRPLPFVTRAVTDPVGKAPTDEGTSDVDRLRQRLGSGRHFVLPLIKRSPDTVSPGRISVGRARNNDVVLRNDSISKLHAWLEIGQLGLSVSDAGSKNGTFRANERLVIKTPTKFSWMETLRFGNISTFGCDATTFWAAFHESDAAFVAPHEL
jgi:hypothetical protein